jgi:MYXO-CTERM domain-containing protein
MKRLLLCGILGVLGMAPAMFADVIDYLLNVNGTNYCDSGSGTGCSNTGFPSGPGDSSTLNTSFDTTGNGGTPYGLGSVNLTFNPGAAGSYNVGLWLFEELTPNSGYDEYGATGGSLGTGESWQIDTPDYDIGGDPNTSATGAIIANTEANTLSDTNDVPGGVDSITGTCPSPNCNDYTSLALSQDFTLATNQEELLSFTVSTTAPTSGFYLEQIDPGTITGVPATYYYSVTAQTVSVCTTGCSTVPEPSSWIPLGLFASVLVLALAVRRRSATA